MSGEPRGPLCGMGTGTLETGHSASVRTSEAALTGCRDGRAPAKRAELDGHGPNLSYGNVTRQVSEECELLAVR